MVQFIEHVANAPYFSHEVTYRGDNEAVIEYDCHPDHGVFKVEKYGVHRYGLRCDLPHRSLNSEELRRIGDALFSKV